MRATLLCVLLAITACTMTPRLTLPTSPVAGAYPLAMGGEAVADWREMFGDPRLQRLIALALDQNRDLRAAALDAEAARAQIRIQRAQGLPGIGLDSSYTDQFQAQKIAGTGVGISGSGGSSGNPTYSQASAQLSVTSFEIDLFGRLRAQNEAAKERYFASVEGRRAVRLAVIGAVVDAYLAERLADEQQRLTAMTLADWRASRDITRSLKGAGQASGVDIAQAEGQVAQAQADLSQRERERMQASNALTLAVGAPLPADLPSPVNLMNQPIRIALAPGTPSDLLTRRPDIARAEHDLRAANAEIGAARAAFFPRISLTSAFGFSSRALASLFSAGSQIWSYTPTLSAPIFRGGELHGNLDLARIRSSQAVTNYEKTIEVAFREVADGLAARATFTRQLVDEQEAARQAERRAALALASYRAGISRRLEVLDAQRSAYAAQQTVLTLRYGELINASALYRALGGSLEDEAPPQAASSR